MSAMTLADLTDEHKGRVVRVETPDGVKAARYLRVIGLRRWEYKGQERIGVTTDAVRGGRDVQTHAPKEGRPVTPCLHIPGRFHHGPCECFTGGDAGEWWHEGQARP